MRKVRCTRAIAVAAAIAAVVGLGAYRASADTPAVTITEGNNIVFSNQTLGWKFTTSEDVYVTQLGFWDERADGLQQSHRIGIWQFGSPGVPVIQGTIAAGSGAPLEGGFRWMAITPTVLSAGTYMMGAHGLSQDWEYGTANGGLTESAVVDYQGSYYSADGTGFSYPDTASGWSNGFFGPNFKYDPVPEPALLQLPFLLGMGGLVWWRRRRP